MQEIWYSLTELSNLLNISKVAIFKLIRNKILNYKVVPHPGGKKYLISSEDPYIKSLLSKASSVLVPPADTQLSASNTSSAISQTIVLSNGLASSYIPEKAHKIAMARFEFLEKINEFIKKNSDMNKTDAIRLFLSQYNNREIHLYLFDVLGEISIQTYYRWQKEYDSTKSYNILIPLNIYKSAKPELTEEEEKEFKKYLLSPNKPSLMTAYRLTKHNLYLKNIPSPSSYYTFKRYAEKFIRENYHTYILAREGEKALKDYAAPYILRDISKLKPGQVLVADGHTLNFEVINPYTGKPCRATIIGYLDWYSFRLAGFEIMVTENVQAIASALRNAIVTIGKIPEYCYQDNGKAFAARYFTNIPQLSETGIAGLFHRLGTKPIFSLPYNARTKVIERYWKLFTDYFERQAPTFTGSNIDDKPAWRKQNEKLHKALHRQYIPTIEETIYIINNYYIPFMDSLPCPHQKNKSIGEVFNEAKGEGIDINNLDFLMLESKNVKIYRNGIRFLGRFYYNEALFGISGTATIKYSFFDVSKIYVYIDNQLLCAAEPVPLCHPLANYEGTKEDVQTLKAQLSLQNRLIRKAKQDLKQILGSAKKIDIPNFDPSEVPENTIDKLEKSELLPALPDYERHLPAIENANEEINTNRNNNNIEPLFRYDHEYYEYLLKKSNLAPHEQEWIEWYKTTDSYRLIYASNKNQEEVL